jgi:hypothetical protein
MLDLFVFTVTRLQISKKQIYRSLQNTQQRININYSVRDSFFFSKRQVFVSVNQDENDWVWPVRESHFFLKNKQQETSNKKFKPTKFPSKRCTVRIIVKIHYLILTSALCTDDDFLFSPPMHLNIFQSYARWLI